MAGQPAILEFWVRFGRSIRPAQLQSADHGDLALLFNAIRTSLSARNPVCSKCGRPASGNFCQNCGADLGGRFCSQCGVKISFGSNFCGQCGAQVSRGVQEGAARREAARDVVIGGQTLPWWIAGVTMFALILFVGLSMVRAGPGPVPSTSGPVQQGLPAAGLATGGAAPDISNMSPIEAADRLFNRVMQATSSGDSAQDERFFPWQCGLSESTTTDLGRPVHPRC